LSVGSDAFTLRTHASFGRAQVREEYLLLRTQQHVRLLWRERVGWQF
jgi:general secretion pathway protein K